MKDSNDIVMEKLLGTIKSLALDLSLAGYKIQELEEENTMLKKRIEAFGERFNQQKEEGAF